MSSAWQVTQVQIVGVTVNCNSATVLYDIQMQHWNGYAVRWEPAQPTREIAMMTAMDNGKWFLTLRNGTVEVE